MATDSAHPNKRACTPSEVTIQPPKRQRPDYSSDGLVTVLVGPSEKSYSVHKTTICATSKYFEAACSTRWTEGNSGVIKLPEYDTATFDTFLHYTYTSQLDMTLAAEETDTPNFPTYEDLAKVWGIANYLQNRHLRNRVIDEVLLGFDRHPVYLIPSALTAVYEIAPEGSTFRRLVQDFHLCKAGAFDFDHHAKDWPFELVMAAARRYCNREAKTLTRCQTLRDAACTMSMRTASRDAIALTAVLSRRMTATLARANRLGTST